MATLRTPITDNTENVTSIPIVQNLEKSDYRVIYLLEATDLSSEDVLLLKSQFEVTNPYSYEVNFGYFLLRADSPTEVYEGEKITRPVSASVPEVLHHYMGVLVGVDNNVTGSVYYNVVGYCRSSLANAGDLLTVEQNYGDLTALVFERKPASLWQKLCPWKS